jgi:hypothetical protein
VVREDVSGGACIQDPHESPLLSSKGSMLIFDRFPSRELAEEFVAAVKEAFGLKGWVYDEQETACQTDVFPWKLDPPIVHVERCWDREDRSDLEWKVRDFVDYFGGTFAGA